MSRSGHSARAIIRVQKGAPVKLLVGTDLLPKLEYYFVQASGESSICNALDNVLDVSVYKSDDRERKVDATVPEVTQGNVDNCDILSIGVHKSDNGDGKVDATVPELAQQNVVDCDIPVISVHKSDNGESKTNATVPEMAQQNVDVSGAGVNNSDDKQDKVDNVILGVAKHNVESVEVEASSSELGTVSLIKAVKIPARHQKLVRVQVTNNLFGQQHLIFEPQLTNEENCLLAPEALISPDLTNRFNLILENHGCEPVYLESGQELDDVGNVVVCSEQDNINTDDEVLPSVNFLTTEQLVIRRIVLLHLILGINWRREECKLFEALKTDESNLTADEAGLLKELVREYSDIFILDSTELGTTDLVTHSIDTGDSHPIRQPLRRIQFALQRTVEEMVQKMMAQGVIQNSNSPWASPVVLIKKKDGSHRFCVD